MKILLEIRHDGTISEPPALHVDLRLQPNNSRDPEGRELECTEAGTGSNLAKEAVMDDISAPT